MVLIASMVAPLASRAADPCCEGDCNGDAAVRINELVAVVDVALGTQPLSACENGFCPCSGPDPGEICEFTMAIRAVDNALYGCPR